MRLVIPGLLVALLLRPGGPRVRRPLTPKGGARSRLRAGVSRVWALTGRSTTTSEVASLPDLLELAARSRRAGLTLLQSLVAASESVPEVRLGRALAQVDAGSSLADALDDWASSIDHVDVELVVAVLLLGDASGAAVAARLDHTAATLRQRAVLADEVRALTAQTRASATVVALAPLGFAFVVAATDDRFVGVMFGTWVGRLSVVSGLALDVIGVLWMRRLTRVVV